MKRSNRLVILVGVLLAVLAFVAIVILLNQQQEVTPEAEVTQKVLVATGDIAIGEEVTPDKVEVREIPPDAAQGTPLTDPSAVSGQPAVFPIPAGAQVTGESIGLGNRLAVDLPRLLEPGEKAIAFQVDRVTGADFLIKPGDSIDVLLSQSITVLQETADSAANTDENAPARFEAVTGLENQRTVKAILQDKRVLYVSATRAQELEPVEDTNGDGVVDDNDEPPTQAAIDSVIIVFAGTDQDAEVIKFAQNALGEQGALTAVVRHTDDDAVETTTGITIDLLVSDYGLRLPEIVQQLNEEATP
ncbi:MAG TPA: Flp pilus assembly protein CpaB [Candidatus Limnocylindria bacterium]|nr:Flp pilus assembly protein CpaB [Candidatus Limnocylindria bacterium]